MTGCSLAKNPEKIRISVHSQSFTMGEEGEGVIKKVGVKRGATPHPYLL